MTPTIKDFEVKIFVVKPIKLKTSL